MNTDQLDVRILSRQGVVQLWRSQGSGTSGRHFPDLVTQVVATFCTVQFYCQSQVPTQVQATSTAGGMSMHVYLCTCARGGKRSFDKLFVPITIEGNRACIWPFIITKTSFINSSKCWSRILQGKIYLAFIDKLCVSCLSGHFSQFVCTRIELTSLSRKWTKVRAICEKQMCLIVRTIYF